MEHERDNRTPEFDYAAALEEHHANAAALKAHCEQYPNAWFSQPTVYYPMPPSLDQVPEETTDASRSLSVAPETSSDVEMADAASDVRVYCLLTRSLVPDYFHAVRVHRSDGKRRRRHRVKPGFSCFIVPKLRPRAAKHVCWRIRSNGCFARFLALPAIGIYYYFWFHLGRSRTAYLFGYGEFCRARVRRFSRLLLISIFTRVTTTLT